MNITRYLSHQDYKFLANNFALSDAENNTSGPLSRGGIGDLKRQQLRDSNWIRIHNHLARKRTLNHLAKWLSCVVSTYPYDAFDCTRFSVNLHSIIVWTSRNSLLLHPPTKFTSSSRNTKFKDILPWNISWIIKKTISIRIAISYAMKWSIPFFEFVWKLMETETTTWSDFPNGGEAIVEQIIVSEGRNISKRAGP